MGVINMFNTEEFKIYVGDKSAVSYISGLNRIEHLYNADIDKQFELDKCSSLVEKLKLRKRDNSLSETERKSASDMHSHLMKYIAFRNSIDFVDGIDKKIKNVITLYKNNFIRINNEERYKWEAIHTYKKAWNIDASNFAYMLSSAFKDSANLLKAGSYYPYKMLMTYAEAEPEKVRALFKTLYNEALPFEKRYTAFKNEFNDYFKTQNLNSYQDLHAISVYLTFEYPEKYYIYKYKVLKSFINNIAYQSGNIDAMTDVQKFQLNHKVCDAVLEAVMNDKELQEISMERLDDTCYEDNAFHILTHDIVYFGSQKSDKPDKSIDDIWFPSLKEYDPGITVEQWVELLNNPDVFTIGSLETVKRMKDYGGQATCKELSVKYGNTAQFYNMTSSLLAKRVHKITNCPVTKRENDNSKWWPILYVGKEADEETDGAFIWKLRDELSEALEMIDLSHIKLYADKGDETSMKTNISKNTILYGPPGTGKTYNTVIYAVAIIENKPLETIEAEVKSNGYNSVLERYNNYKNEELIEFITFHQSYGYEEFIEGIKPVIDNEENEQSNIRYTIDDGVFKAFCDKASIISNTNSKIDFGFNKNPTIWKVSLFTAGDNYIRTDCLENGHIRICWDEYGAEITENTDFSEFGGRNVLNAFISQMKIGDIIFSCYTSTTIDAIGVVTGEYEWCEDEYDFFKRKRKVNWIVRDIRENIIDINNGNPLTQMSVYKLNRIALSDVMAIIEKHLPQVVEEKKKNRVFIIDEINRGNISKIFGELITLIEPTKRTGQAEGMKVKLPYSAKPFGVPDNVYILGTMNTADRSIAMLDTALRRRFRFKEIMPNPDILNGINIEGISISDMLTRINKRISVLYDREHTIGHAYFIPLKDNPTIEQLAEIFENAIIPLLQEYFYEDYEKIRMVLGDNQKKDTEQQFIIKTVNNYYELFGNVDDLDETYDYSINNNVFYNIEAYKNI